MIPDRTVNKGGVSLEEKLLINPISSILFYQSPFNPDAEYFFFILTLLESVLQGWTCTYFLLSITKKYIFDFVA